MLTRLARWWLTRQTRRRPVVMDECERCGQPADHVVTAAADDDARLGIEQGGTGFAASYCRRHCPGGCRARHWVRRSPGEPS